MNVDISGNLVSEDFYEKCLSSKTLVPFGETLEKTLMRLERCSSQQKNLGSRRLNLKFVFALLLIISPSRRNNQDTK